MPSHHPLRYALVTLLLTGTAHAGNNEVTVGSHTRSLRTSSANAVTDDNLAGAQLQYGRRLALDVVPRLEVWMTATYLAGNLTGTPFRSMATAVRTDDFLIGGRARYFVLSHLAATAHVAAGAARTSLSLSSGADEVKDAGWGSIADAAVGLDLLLVSRPRFTCGLRLDLGYLATSGVALAPAAEKDSDMLQLTTAQASIGQLDLSGRYVAFTFLAQF